MSYRHHHHCHHDTGTGCLIMAGLLIILGFVAAPLVGLGMCFSDNSEERGLGVFVLIVGIIAWIYFAMVS